MCIYICHNLEALDLASSIYGKCLPYNQFAKPVLTVKPFKSGFFSVKTFTLNLLFKYTFIQKHTPGTTIFSLHSNSKIYRHLRHGVLPRVCAKPLGSAVFCNNVLVALISRDSQIGVVLWVMEEMMSFGTLELFKP